MEQLLEIIEHKFFQRVLQNGFPFTGKSKLIAGLFALYSALAISALGYFLYAAHNYYSINLSSESAPFAMAFTLLSSAMATALIALAILKYRAHKTKIFQKELMLQAEKFLLLAKAEYAKTDFKKPVQQAPLQAAVIAAIAGFIASKKLF
jgi:hypothetical protein